MMPSPRALGRYVPARLLGHLRTPLYRNGYALVASSASSSVIGIAYWIAAARIYAPEAVGSNAAAIAAMMFLAGVAQLGLVNALLRFIPTAGRRTAPFVMSAYLAAAPVAALVSIVFVGGINTWAPNLAFLGASPTLSLWFTLGTSAWCIFALQDSVLTGLRQAHWVLVENVAFALAKVGLLVLFVALLPEYGVLASWTAAMAVSILPTNLLIFLRLIPRHVRATAGQGEPFDAGKVIRYLPGDYLGSLCSLAAMALLPVIVAQVAGPAATAYFYIAWQVAYALSMVSSNMGSSLVVEAARDPARLSIFSYRVMVRTFMVVGPAAGVLVLAAEAFLRVFGESYAAEGTMLLRLLALAALPHVFLSLSIGVLRVQRRTWMVVAVLALLCTLSLTLCFVLLRAYGIVGVGLGWLASETAVALLVVLTQLLPLWGLRRSSSRDGSNTLSSPSTMAPRVVARWNDWTRLALFWRGRGSKRS